MSREKSASSSGISRIPGFYKLTVAQRRVELCARADLSEDDLATLGGGARALEVRAHAGRVIVHVHIDCRNAMGANMVNTVAEALADRVSRLADGQRGLRILTNLCDRRCVRVQARVPAQSLATAGLD